MEGGQLWEVTGSKAVPVCDLHGFVGISPTLVFEIQRDFLEQ